MHSVSRWRFVSSARRPASPRADADADAGVRFIPIAKSPTELGVGDEEMQC